MANRVILMGNLGQEPDLKYTPSGTAVCNMTMATTKKFKNKAGEKQEETSWHNLVAWAAQAEIMAKYLAKGSKVYIEGELGYEKYINKQEVEITKAVITVREFEFAGGKGGESQPAQGGGSASQGNWRAPASTPAPTEQPFDPSDDNIPF